MGAIMQDYTKLKVWQKSHALTVSMYNVTGVSRGTKSLG